MKTSRDPGGRNSGESNQDAAVQQRVEPVVNNVRDACPATDHPGVPRTGNADLHFAASSFFRLRLAWDFHLKR